MKTPLQEVQKTCNEPPWPPFLDRDDSVDLFHFKSIMEPDNKKNANTVQPDQSYLFMNKDGSICMFGKDKNVSSDELFKQLSNYQENVQGLATTEPENRSSRDMNPTKKKRRKFTSSYSSIGSGENQSSYETKQYIQPTRRPRDVKRAQKENLKSLYRSRLASSKSTNAFKKQCETSTLAMNIGQKKLPLERQPPKNLTNKRTRPQNRAPSRAERREPGRPKLHESSLWIRQGKEDQVLSKRSIFRFFKRAASEKYKGCKSLKLPLVSQFKKWYKVDTDLALRLVQVAKDCAYCMCKEQSQKKGEETYFPYIGNVCYQYSAIAKERFFRNYAACYLFVKLVEKPYPKSLENVAQGKKKTLLASYRSLIKQAKWFKSQA